MRFSLIYEAQTASVSPEADFQMFHDIVDQCLLAESVGFDIIWAVEHTALTKYAHMSAPETFLAYLAGRTSSIHVGHGVVCLPPHMNHPVKVAERIATLDILSRGRLHFGMGKGGTQQESGTFGYDLNELRPMIDESMYLIPKILASGEVEHDGQFTQIPYRPVHPYSYQRPHPPLYLACTNDPSLEQAGLRGIGGLVLGFGGPEEVARKNEIYRDAWSRRTPDQQVGFSPNQHLSALCPTVVLDDGHQARTIGLRGQRFFMEAISHWSSAGMTPLPEPEHWPEDWIGASEEGGALVTAHIGKEQVTIDFKDPKYALYNPNHAYGTVDDACRYVEQLVAAGADEVMFICQMGTVPQWACLETIRNIGEHVIPKFR